MTMTTGSHDDYDHCESRWLWIWWVMMTMTTTMVSGDDHDYGLSIKLWLWWVMITMTMVSHAYYTKEYYSLIMTMVSHDNYNYDESWCHDCDRSWLLWLWWVMMTITVVSQDDYENGESCCLWWVMMTMVRVWRIWQWWVMNLTVLGILGVVSKQLSLLRGRVGDSTAVVDSLSPRWDSRSRMLLLLAAVTYLGILGSLGMSSRNLLSVNFNFSVFTLSMSLRYLSKELYSHGPNKVIAFS